MNQNILHVDLDVDDTQFHGSAFNKDIGAVIDFRCRPTLRGLGMDIYFTRRGTCRVRRPRWVVAFDVCSHIEHVLS